MKGDFYGGGNEKIFGCSVESPPPLPLPPNSRVSHKGPGEGGGTVHTWLVQKGNIKGGGIFGKKGDTWGVILEDNPATHCFVLRDLGSSSFFK